MEPAIKQKSLMARGSVETWKNKSQSDEVQRDGEEGEFLVRGTRVEDSEKFFSFCLMLD